jgi:hypothetical protein
VGQLRAQGKTHAENGRQTLYAVVRLFWWDRDRVTTSALVRKRPRTAWTHSKQGHTQRMGTGKAGTHRWQGGRRQGHTPGRVTLMAGTMTRKL